MCGAPRAGYPWAVFSSDEVARWLHARDGGALELERECFGRLVARLPVPVLVVDPAGQVVLASAAVRAWGWEPDQLPGRGLAALLQAHPERARWAVRVDGQELTVIHLREAGSGARSLTAARPPATGAGRTALIVEDDDEVRALVAEYLRLLGHDALETSSPLQALRVLEERGSQVAVLLTDLLLPFLSGPELIGLARRICPELAVVTMSGYPPEETAAGLTGPLAPVCLHKPFTLAQLRAALERASALRDQ